MQAQRLSDYQVAYGAFDLDLQQSTAFM